MDDPINIALLKTPYGNGMTLPFGIILYQFTMDNNPTSKKPLDPRVHNIIMSSGIVENQQD